MKDPIPTVILGVPVNPCAFVAVVAVSALPVKAPTKVVAVTTPVELRCLDDISFTVISGVPVSPWEVVEIPEVVAYPAVVAEVAEVAVSALPLKAPLKVVAVITPTTLALPPI